MYRDVIEASRALALKALDVHGGQGKLDFMALSIVNLADGTLSSPELAKLESQPYILSPPSYTEQVFPIVDTMIRPLTARLDELNAIDGSLWKKLFWIDRSWGGYVPRDGSETGIPVGGAGKP